MGLGFNEFLKRVKGKRIAIGGNRSIPPSTQKLIRIIVKRVLAGGFSIVTGGAEGADHAAMKECLKHPGRISVFLPSTIEKQYERYRKIEGATKAKRLRDTLSQLKKSNPGSIIENRKWTASAGNYRTAANMRNSAIVRVSSGFIVVCPKGSRGTADALRKIAISSKPLLVLG